MMDRLARKLLRVVAVAMTRMLHTVLDAAVVVPINPKIVVQYFPRAVLVVVQQKVVTWYPYHRNGP